MEWKYLRKIRFQGFGTKSPYFHHNFHHKRHQVQWYYHLSQQFTQEFMELPCLVPIYVKIHIWIRNIFDIVIVQDFGIQ